MTNVKLTFLALALVVSTLSFAQKGFDIQVDDSPGRSSITGRWSQPTSGSGIPGPNGSRTYISMQKAATWTNQFGGSMGYHFTDCIGISIGLNFTKQGQKYSDYTFPNAGNQSNYYQEETVTRSLELDYVKIPLLIHFHTNPGKMISFSVYAGIYKAFLMSYHESGTDSYSEGSGGKVGFTSNSYDSAYTTSGTTVHSTSNSSSSWQVGVKPTQTTSSTSDRTATLSGKPYKSDFGVSLGAGIQFKLSSRLRLPILLTAQYGFSDIKNATAVVTYAPGYTGTYFASDNPNLHVSQRNNFIGLLIGIQLRL